MVKKDFDLTNRCFFSDMKFSIGIGELVQECQQFSKNLVKVAILVMVPEFLVRLGLYAAPPHCPTRCGTIAYH